jgi:hypothetical protein
MATVGEVSTFEITAKTILGFIIVAITEADYLREPNTWSRDVTISLEQAKQSVIMTIFISSTDDRKGKPREWTIRRATKGTVI